jgi:hypothetical protein
MALKLSVALSRKPQTHTKLIGVSDQFTGTGGAPRRRRNKSIGLEIPALPYKYMAWLSEPSTAMRNAWKVLSAVLQMHSLPFGCLRQHLVGDASVTANMSWRGNTQDMNSGNRKWSPLPA